MRLFISGSEEAFADLESRARESCVVFRDQPMPPGSVPQTARVGFEISPLDGSAHLFVERGIAYAGHSEEVQQWLTGGEKGFPSFTELKDWVRDYLGPCYRSPVSRRSDGDKPPAPSRAEELTDLAAIREGAKSHGSPLYLSEEALFREMSSHVRGQDEVLRLLSRRVCRHIARRRPRRPATFFALGPTGVGKTKTAESLPVALRTLDPSGAGYGYLRLDMAEYQEPHRISQMLGAPQGYIGYGDGAQLVDALTVNPKTVVLFDEIEKAHPNILRTLMNAMDAGRLSTPSNTSHGRELDCRFAIFIFTSNIDSTGILKDLEEREAFENQAVVDQVCRNRLCAFGVSRELVGRINCFLVFRGLGTDTLAEIASLTIVRVAQEYGLQVGHIEPSVVVALLGRVRTDGFGVRPFEYVVDDLLGECFANAAEASIQCPVQVCGGPPFHCIALSLPSVSAVCA